MVMLVNHSKTICTKLKAVQGVKNLVAECEDALTTDIQLQAAKDFEREVDRDDDSYENGSGWYKIVYTPKRAREVVDADKLAVVLGIETSEPFGCSAKNTSNPNESGLARCNQTDYVENAVAELCVKGVRHVFPIHNIDNAFGGTALYREFFNAAQKEQNGYWYGYRANGTTTNANGALTHSDAPAWP